MASGLLNNSQRGFCPFCGESFPGSQCPEHELELVAWEQLPAARRAEVSAVTIPQRSLRAPLARLLLWLGAFGWLASFLGRFVTIDLQPPLALSGLQFALSRAYNLWSVPLAAMVVGAILLRRRDLPALMRARLALVVAAVMPLIAVGYTLFGILRWLRVHAPAASIHLGPGAYLTMLCSGCAMLGVVLLSSSSQSR